MRRTLWIAVAGALGACATGHVDDTHPAETCGEACGVCAAADARCLPEVHPCTHLDALDPACGEAWYCASCQAGTVCGGQCRGRGVSGDSCPPGVDAACMEGLCCVEGVCRQGDTCGDLPPVFDGGG
jgi:hypothetical protein